MLIPDLMVNEDRDSLEVSSYQGFIVLCNPDRDPIKARGNLNSPHYDDYEDQHSTDKHNLKGLEYSSSPSLPS